MPNYQSNIKICLLIGQYRSSFIIPGYVGWQISKGMIAKKVSVTKISFVSVRTIALQVQYWDTLRF